MIISQAQTTNEKVRGVYKYPQQITSAIHVLNIDNNAQQPNQPINYQPITQTVQLTNHDDRGCLVNWYNALRCCGPNQLSSKFPNDFSQYVVMKEEDRGCCISWKYS